jgi:hypothetical protein
MRRVAFVSTANGVGPPDAMAAVFASSSGGTDMIARIAGLAGALVAAGVSLTSPALAQSKYAFDVDKMSHAQKDELYCVYDLLADDDLYLIADVYLDNTDEKDDIDRADRAIDAATSKCDAKYNWNGDLEGIASGVAVDGAIVDVITDDLSSTISDDKMETIFALLDKLSDADLDAIADGKAEDDGPFHQKLTAALIADGVPDKNDVMDNAFIVMKAAVDAAAQIVDWIDEKKKS